MKPSLIAKALLTAALAFSLTAQVRAAYEGPVTWADLSSLDIRKALRSQYATKDNLFQPVISPAAFEVAVRDSDGKVSPPFRIPPELRGRVAFWLHVYAQYTTEQMVFFDRNHPELVYEVLDLHDLALKSRNSVALEINSRLRVHATVLAYRAAIKALAKNPSPSQPTREEKLVLEAVKRAGFKRPLAELKGSLMIQLGQRDNIMKGLLAAEAFFPKMEEIFDKEGVPRELTRLPLVESSFDLKARSRKAAAGIWQFIPQTGRAYLRIDNQDGIDERLSPLKASEAAAQLLLHNYRASGSWPLAVTAYNQGTRILTKFPKSCDFQTYAHLFEDSHRGRRLGWAGRNYYAEFLAVVHAEAYRDLFYGKAPLTHFEAIAYEPVNLPLSAARIARDRGISSLEFRFLNPDIRNLYKPLPKGFLVALPASKDDLAALAPARSSNRAAARSGRVARHAHGHGGGWAVGPSSSAVVAANN